MGTAMGAFGVAEDSDQAIFPNVDVGMRLGHDGGIALRLPVVVPGLGSTEIARRHWDGLAVGCAISGIMLTIGENVVGMDPAATFEHGKVVDAPELRRRVQLYQNWARGEGAIVVQENVEDSRLGTLEYAIDDLGVDAVELKWGQGAKDIGGEVKIIEADKARMLQDRGYLVLPDPAGHEAELAWGRSFTEYERHSRIGMVSRDAFMERVGQLRDAGAKYVFLKTGAYRPADLARAIKFASEARLDLLTIDGAGGGTGMSPWRMMNEWGIPTLYLESLAYQYAHRLALTGSYVPAIAISGGLSMEDHLFKAVALGAPYVRLAGMARSALTAAMVGRTVGRLIDESNLPKHLVKHGEQREEVFAKYLRLREEYADIGELPDGAIGVYTYMCRLAQGLRQLMTGSRKFSLEHLSRHDLGALSREAADLTGIAHVCELDAEEVDAILEGAPVLTAV
jgi:glutamate synthase domain-containing protein 2